jgi:hypothetical protein
MSLSSTKLRQNHYSILDQVLETGVPAQIERNGRILVIEPQGKASKWERLEEHSIIAGAPEDFVHMDWSGEWKGAADS